MEPEGSLPHLQVPAAAYPEPDQSSLCNTFPLPEDLGRTKGSFQAQAHVSL